MKNKTKIKRQRRGLLSRLVRAVFKLVLLMMLAAATWSAFFIGTYSTRPLFGEIGKNGL